MTRKHTFTLTEKDNPGLLNLESVSKDQYIVLMASDGPEKTSYINIATALSVPVGTVKSRLHRARAKIVAWRQKEVELEKAAE